jgi:hypothetical protein
MAAIVAGPGVSTHPGRGERSEETGVREAEEKRKGEMRKERAEHLAARFDAERAFN